MPDSTPNNASLPDLNKISSWTASDYASLTADFVSKMTVAQVHLMSNAQLVAPKAISGFTADQIPELAVDFYIVTGEWLNQLNEAATKAITPDQMTRLTFSSLAKLDTKHLGLLSADQVAGINDNYQWYSATWLNSLTSEAFKGIPINKLNQIKLQDFCLLDAEHIKAISSEKLAALNDGHLKALTSEQVALIPDLASLSSPQYGLLNISGLPSSFFADMSQAQYAGLTAHQISTLSLEQVKSMKHVDWVPANSATGFTAEQMASIHAEEFSSANLNKLSIASLKALSGEQVALIGDLSGLDNAHLKALTAAQVNAITGISTLSNEQFALLDLSAMSASTIAGWTVTEYSGLTAHQISTLSNEQIQAMQRIDWIPAATVTGFTAAQISSFSNDMLSQLTTDQVAAITHLSALTSQQFGLLNISQLSKVAINYLSQTEYEGLTAQQIATLKPEQIYEMWHTSWMPDDAATAFTAEQVQSINISMGYFTAGWLNHLSIEAFQALTPAQAAQISAATMAALDNAHLQALTAEQIGSMNKFGDLSGEQFGLLNISKLSTSAINALSRSQYEGITAGQISSLSTDQIYAMNHVDWLLSEAIAVFTKEQQQSISVSMGYFTSTWFNSLSDEAIKGVTAAQLSHIDASNFSKWDNNHLAALTAEQVVAAPYLKSLTSEQFGNLDISKLSVSAIEQMSKTEYLGLTEKQISSLSPEQTQALQHIDWISPDAAKGFTAAQMPAFTNDISAFTAAFLNNLTIAAFAGITPTQLASLTPVTFASLDYQHFWALNDLSALTEVMSSLSNDQLLTVSQMMSLDQVAQLPESQRSLINTSVETGFSLVDTISDTGLKTLMHNAVTNDASLFSFTTIESVLKDFASQLTGDLTENQFNDINNYVQAIGNVCGTDSAIYSLVNGLIGTGGASINWTATGPGERIGSLAVGSSITQFNQLISTWFDGANAPASSSLAHVDGRPLFAKGGPRINDIHQGGVADCSLLSSLITVVNAQPDFIKSMIVQNPNDTYSVRFFNNGVAHWVTVDGNTYSSGANSSNSSWVAIVERANVAFEATYLNDVNSYSSLVGGKAKLMEVTGDTLTILRAVATSEGTWDTTDFETLKTAVLNGAPAAISSWENSTNATTGQSNFISGHAFAIIGFDEKTNDFIVANPWGADRTDGVQGTFEASMDQMWQHGNFSTGIWIANSNGASNAAGQLVHAMAAMNTSPSAALTTAALPANMNNPQLAASHV